MEKNDNFKSELETQYSILIQNKEKNEQKRFIFITTILVVTLCSVLCSIVFSFIAFKNSKNINLSTKVRDITYYQTLSVKYNGDNQLSLTNITNNYELPVPKTIEITNEGTTDIVFDIKLSSINTSLLSTNKLVYTLLRNNEVVVTTASYLVASSPIIRSSSSSRQVHAGLLGFEYTIAATVPSAISSSSFPRIASPR